MRLFSHSQRAVHLGPFPMERLGRGDEADLGAITSTGLLREDFPDRHLGRAISDFLCALDAVREGGVASERAQIPSDPQERANHLKAAGYFLDSALVGVCALQPGHLLAERTEHPNLRGLSFEASKEKLRLRFNPAAVIRQMEQSIALADRPMDDHRFALVFAVEHPRDPVADEPGSEWIADDLNDLQPWRAAMRACETATVIANYLRLLGYRARSHSATTSEVNLHRLAVSAGIAQADGKGGIVNPFIGRRFDLAAVTTSLELAPDVPLRRQSIGDTLRSKGPAWWIGAAAPRSGVGGQDFKNRTYRDSRYPTEKLKRVEKTTTFIDEPRVPRVPKSSEFFLRAAFGDLGKPVLDASKDGYSVVKAPLAGALRLALNVYSLLQRGPAASHREPGYDDPVRNADRMKAAMHFLGADLTGISQAPDWVWYSHRQDGSELTPTHPNAVSVMIDQGYETMEGASGDDWISSAQSMRTYVRAGLVCGVLAQHLRNLGFEATAHSAADSDVLQTPLVLLAGLGEVSRIGDSILNPFLGPRLKTGILTTDFPMQADKPIDFGLQNFCNSCNKCARECPSGAISAGDKVMFNGYEIWKTDVTKCTQYRMTNLGGSMCGRCMKMCPWNLEGLVTEAPFRWAAMHMPWAAKWIARLDDALKRGTINPAKKWWWDVAKDETGRIGPAKATNTRGLNTHITVTRKDQTLAMFPAELSPPPLPMPSPLDREAGIKKYDEALTPDAYKERLAKGQTDGLVGKVPMVGAEPPVMVARIGRRLEGSADGKIDIFQIVSRDGSDLPPFTAGAHIDVTVTPQFIRQYSLAGDPADRSHYLIGVLREDEGRGGSKKLHQMMREGTPLVVSRPRNHFPIIADARRHVLLAGGIGVTPLIAMGHELAAQGADFTLYYKCRTRAQAAFIEQLEQVAWHDKVRFHFSDEDRLDIATVLNAYQDGDHVYTCGPNGFMDAVFETATAHGWPDGAMHREFFSVPEGESYENHPFELEIASTGQVIQVPAEKKATEALMDAGVPVNVKCSDGLCGVCATGYRDGEVEHRDFVLSKAQRETTVILCCSRAAKAEGRITLDI